MLCLLQTELPTAPADAIQRIVIVSSSAQSQSNLIASLTILRPLPSAPTLLPTPPPGVERCPAARGLDVTSNIILPNATSMPPHKLFAIDETKANEFTTAISMQRSQIHQHPATISSQTKCGVETGPETSTPHMEFMTGRVGRVGMRHGPNTCRSQNVPASCNGSSRGPARA